MNRLMLLCALASLLAVSTAQAGGPKPEHPCYAVADCKTKTSQKEFSACIKANKEEAKANETCASFRKDKDAWLKSNGVPNVKALFES
jgi:hypothetical protein